MAAALGAAVLAWVSWPLLGEKPREKARASLDSSSLSPSGIPQHPTPRAREYQLTEEMGLLAIGLETLFTPEDLAFRTGGLENQIREALSTYDEDWVLSLAKLEKALNQLDAEQAPAAFALVRSLLPPGDVSHGKAYRILFRAWARADAPTALNQSVAALPANDIRLFAGEETLGIWAQNDAPTAAKAAAELPDTFGKDYLIYTVPYTFARQDPNQAVAWADSLPENYARGALQHCMLQWLDQDPQGAAKHALARASEGGGIDSRNDIIITEVAEYLASQSHEAAMRWLEQMPDTSIAYYKGLETVVEFWAETNPNEAGEWLRKAPSSPQMDPVIDRYVRALAMTNPTEALEWSKSIQTSGLRVMSVRAVLKMWSERAPELARKWAKENGYSLFPTG